MMTMMLVAALAPALVEAKTRRAAPRTDPQIRYVTFNNNAVTTVPCALGISTMVQLAPDEIIETISAGDTKSWSIVPKKGSGIFFVKPIAANARTNVNLVTNKRVYALLLVSAGENTDTSAFHVRFRYPDEINAKQWEAAAAESVKNPDLKILDPASLNYDYVFKGFEGSKPRVVFDNGVKTFMQFDGDVPAIFTVGDGRNETPVNFRREGDYLVIDRVAAQFTLRAADGVTCLFNRRKAPAPDAIETIYGPKPAERSALGDLFQGGR